MAKSALIPQILLNLTNSLHTCTKLGKIEIGCILSPRVESKTGFIFFYRVGKSVHAWN